MDMQSLLQLKSGEKGRIVSIEGGRGLVRNLQRMGLREGKIIRIVTRQLAGGPIVVKADNSTITLGRGMAAKILVERA